MAAMDPADPATPGQYDASDPKKSESSGVQERVTGGNRMTKPTDGTFWVDPHPQTTGEVWLSRGKLCLLTLPWIGIQCTWSAQFAQVTPYLEALGISPRFASNIWLSGPIMGFFVAPIVGALSDKCHSRLGRRRPYMLGGLLTLGACATLAGTSRYMGDAGLPIAITMFIIMDGIINIIQTPTRALAADFAPPDQQSTVQLLAVVFQGVGGLLGYAYTRVMAQQPLDVLPLFMTVFATNLVFVGITMVFVKEEFFPRPQDEKVAICEPFIHLFGSIKLMTGKLLIVGSCVFFCWFSLFSWWPVSSTWFSTWVFKGCCTDPAEEPGVCSVDDFQLCQDGLEANSNVGIAANALQIVLGVTFALLMNLHILKRVKYLWSGLLAVGAALMIASKFVFEIWFSYVVGIGMAIPISGINAFPFAIVGRYRQEDESSKGSLDVGAQFGLLNLFITVPQIITTISISEMRNAGLLEWGLFMSGISFGIASLIAIFIIEPPIKKPTEEDVEEAVA